MRLLTLAALKYISSFPFLFLDYFVYNEVIEKKMVD